MIPYQKNESFTFEIKIDFLFCDFENFMKLDWDAVFSEYHSKSYSSYKEIFWRRKNCTTFYFYFGTSFSRIFWWNTFSFFIHIQIIYVLILLLAVKKFTCVNYRIHRKCTLMFHSKYISLTLIFIWSHIYDETLWYMIMSFSDSDKLYFFFVIFGRRRTFKLLLIFIYKVWF